MGLYKPVKIALCGTMRSGKDTVAKYLIDNHNFNTSLAFGDSLKDIAHTIFPWVETEPKPRELYQHMNTMRDYDPDVWIKHLENRYIEAFVFNEEDRIVITDLRQRNELEWCIANDFIIVRVDAPKELRLKRARDTGDDFNEASFNHVTELEVESFDVSYEIVNDGSLENLLGKVDKMIFKIEQESK